jgi:hypothetical protein
MSRLALAVFLGALGSALAVLLAAVFFAFATTFALGSALAVGSTLAVFLVARHFIDDGEVFWRWRVFLLFGDAD